MTCEAVVRIDEEFAEAFLATVAGQDANATPNEALQEMLARGDAWFVRLDWQPRPGVRIIGEPQTTTEGETP